jgi:plasmid stability protein
MPEKTVPVTLSIKNVPDELANALRERAAGNHRSLQGELMAILETSVQGRKPLTVFELLAQVRAKGLKTPAESARIIRTERDAR